MWQCQVLRTLGDIFSTFNQEKFDIAKIPLIWSQLQTICFSVALFSQENFFDHLITAKWFVIAHDSATLPSCLSRTDSSNAFAIVSPCRNVTHSVVSNPPMSSRSESSLRRLLWRNRTNIWDTWRRSPREMNGWYLYPQCTWRQWLDYLHDTATKHEGEQELVLSKQRNGHDSVNVPRRIVCHGPHANFQILHSHFWRCSESQEKKYR